MAKSRLHSQKSQKPVTKDAEAESSASDFESIDPEEFASTDSDFHGFESTDEEASDAEAPSSSEKDSAKAGIAKVASKVTSSETKEKGESERGVVYIGRLPHGFYEDQLREYFGQFGTITRLRISRNKKSGASKHYGFIEFASRDVAQIVTEAMDNYLLFGHLLKVKLMDPAQVHPDIWVGANSKFHAIPWGLVNKQRLERKHSREYWEQKQEEADAERQAKARKLKELGITY